MRSMQTRKIPRKTISIPGRYFTGRGAPADVIVRDLSTGGCRFDTDRPDLAPGTRMQLYLGKSGPHHAIVKWGGKGEVGVTFSVPLDEGLFEGFKSSHVPDLPENTRAGEFDDMPEHLPNRFC